MVPERKVIVLPFDEDSKNIIKALNNETARRILEVVSEEPSSISQLSEKLSLPITTVYYNVKKLLDTGLIRVKYKDYSTKGREIEYYEPTRKIIVLLPEKIKTKEALQALKKYLLVVFVATLSAGFGFIVEFSLSGRLTPARKGVTSLIPTPTLTSHPWLWILVGAIIGMVSTIIWQKTVRTP